MFRHVIVEQWGISRDLRPQMFIISKMSPLASRGNGAPNSLKKKAHKSWKDVLAPFPKLPCIFSCIWKIEFRTIYLLTKKRTTQVFCLNGKVVVQRCFWDEMFLPGPDQEPLWLGRMLASWQCLYVCTVVRYDKIRWYPMGKNHDVWCIYVLHTQIISDHECVFLHVCLHLNLFAYSVAYCSFVGIFHCIVAVRYCRQ